MENNEKKENVSENKELIENILRLFRKGHSVYEVRNLLGCGYYLTHDLYEALNNPNSPYYDPKTYRLIAQKKEETKQKNNLAISNSVKVVNSVFEKFSVNTRKEILLMALAFRVSFKTLSKMFGTTREDVYTLLEGNYTNNFKNALEWLDQETISESNRFEISAYRKAKKYWDERNKLIKELNEASKNKDDIKIKNTQLKIKELHTQIDDTNLVEIRKKNVKELTQEEKDAIARYRLKYGWAAHRCEEFFGYDATVILRMCENLASRDSIFKEKIEALNSFWYNKKFGHAGNSRKIIEQEPIVIESLKAPEEPKEQRLIRARKKKYIQAVNQTADFILEGHTIKETAEKEQVSRDTIKKRINDLKNINLKKYQKIMEEQDKKEREAKEQEIKEKEELTNRILFLYRKGYSPTPVKKIAGERFGLADEIYKGLDDPNSPYYEPETYEKIQRKKEEEHQKYRDAFDDIFSLKVENSVFKKFSVASRREIILVVLTFRVSFKTLAKMFGTVREDVYTLLGGNDDLKESLEWLDKETRNESNRLEILAYRKAKKYWDESKRIKKEINAASENKEEFKAKLKELYTQIDDTNVANLINKNIKELTGEERDAIARYRLKYGLSINKCAMLFNIDRRTVQNLCSNLAERDAIFKEKIEILDAYWYNLTFSKTTKFNSIIEQEPSHFGRGGVLGKLAA